MLDSEDSQEDPRFEQLDRLLDAGQISEEAYIARRQELQQEMKRGRGDDRPRGVAPSPQDSREELSAPDTLYVRRVNVARLTVVVLASLAISVGASCVLGIAADATEYLLMDFEEQVVRDVCREQGGWMCEGTYVTLTCCTLSSFFVIMSSLILVTVGYWRPKKFPQLHRTEQ